MKSSKIILIVIFVYTGNNYRPGYGNNYRPGYPGVRPGYPGGNPNNPYRPNPYPGTYPGNNYPGNNYPSGNFRPGYGYENKPYVRIPGSVYNNGRPNGYGGNGYPGAGSGRPYNPSMNELGGAGFFGRKAGAKNETMVDAKSEDQPDTKSSINTTLSPTATNANSSSTSVSTNSSSTNEP